MTVKDIMRTVATLVGREDVVKYLLKESEGNEEVLSDIDLLTRLINIVVSELACSYVPMVAREKIEVKNGKFYFKDLTKTPLSVKNVYDYYGNQTAYSVTGEYIKTDLGVQIEYTILPSNYGLEDQLGYTEKDISPIILAYGTAAEYSISKGCFDEAVTWHNRYVNALSEVCLPKNKMVKQRSWI